MHIVDQLLEHGYRVRGTVRDANKAVWTSKYFKDRYGVGRYTTAIIPDMSKQHAFDIAIRGCSGIIHVASVTTESSNPNEVITPSIAGAVNALEAAHKEVNLKRFVLTSSVGAAVSCYRGERNEVTSDSWNMLDFDDAWAPEPYDDGRVHAVAASSKMQTEAAVWRWYHRRKPHFILNTGMSTTPTSNTGQLLTSIIVLPDTLWGRTLAPHHQKLPKSMHLLKSIYTNAPIPTLPANFVDVQDSALLHLATLTLPDVKGQRIFAVSTPWNVQSLVTLMRGLWPEKFGSEVMETEDLGVDLTVFREQWKAEELLRRMGRRGWTDLETSVERACEGLF